MRRRDFLRAGAAGAAFFSFSGATVFSPRAEAATLNYALTAQQASKSLPLNRQGQGTQAVTMWQFAGAALATGPGELGAGIIVGEGDTVTVTLTNALTRAINFVVPGVYENSPVCNPGSSQTYTFLAPPAGSYFFTDGLNGELGRAMGLAGPLVVKPVSNSNTLFPGAPVFAREYTLALHELDSRINTMVARGDTPDLSTYEPDYYFVNGLAYPATGTDSSTRLTLRVGEQVALRLINIGLHMNSMHFHGYHVNVMARNRALETAVVEKDTVLVRVGECVDLMLPVTQPGKYELHNHFLPATNGNGVYPLGAMLMMEAA